MKIVIDAFGGDNAPEEIVKGAVAAVNSESGFTAVLVGKADVINSLLKEAEYDKTRIEVINASDVITNDDIPTDAIRKKRDSSLVKCFDIINSDEEAAAFVSAGSTGAVLTGAVLLLSRIKGINRPALAPLLPKIAGEGQVLLVDCGANAECKPLNLLQFGVMGSSFMNAVFGVKAPKVGLLSNGTEDKKGDELHKAAFELLKENENINFAGNIEGRDIISGEYDVVVADGFSGNIALKACEGTAIGMFDLIKKGIMEGGLRAKLGYLLLKPALKGIKKKMDYNDNGGAVMLGLNKIVIKSHGSSKAKSICASILQAKQLHESNFIEKIKAAMGN